MPVAKLVKHPRTHFKQFLIGHPVGNLRGIFGMNGIPVNILLGKEAIMFVENRPKLLECATRVGGIFFNVMAGRHSGHNGNHHGKCPENFIDLFHRLHQCSNKPILFSGWRDAAPCASTPKANRRLHLLQTHMKKYGW